MFAKTIRKIKIIYHHFMAIALENHLDPKSVFHLKKLVSLNDDWGLNHLGCRYVAGKGVEQDFRMAYKCFDRSVSLQGKAMMYAEANIGSLYMNGQYLPLDEKKAAEWFGKAAQKGFPIAQYNYGLALIDGWMGYTSEEEGIKWLKKAEASGLAEASEVLAKVSEI